MTSRLAIMMGGRIAEEMTFGADKVTSGAQSDIEQATRLARMMVTRWGFQPRTRHVAYGENNDEVFLGMSHGASADDLGSHRPEDRRRGPPPRGDRPGGGAPHPRGSTGTTSRPWLRACSNTRPCRATRSATDRRQAADPRLGRWADHPARLLGALGRPWPPARQRAAWSRSPRPDRPLSLSPSTSRARLRRGSFVSGPRCIEPAPGNPIFSLQGYTDPGASSPSMQARIRS